MSIMNELIFFKENFWSFFFVNDVLVFELNLKRSDSDNIRIEELLGSCILQLVPPFRLKGDITTVVLDEFILFDMTFVFLQLLGVLPQWFQKMRGVENRRRSRYRIRAGLQVNIDSSFIWWCSGMSRDMCRYSFLGCILKFFVWYRKSRAKGSGGINYKLGCFDFQFNDFYLFLKSRFSGSMYFSLVGHIYCSQKSLLSSFFSGVGLCN